MDYLALLVGALLAMGGGFSNQLTAHRLKLAETKNNYRRDKLDQLAVTLLEDEHWIEIFRAEQCFGTHTSNTSEPFSRVVATARMYFKERLANEKLTELMKARHHYKVKCMLVRQDRFHKAGAAGETTIAKTLPDGAKLAEVDEAHGPYYAAFLQYQSECEDAAKELI